MIKIILFILFNSVLSYGQTLKSKKIDFDKISAYSDLKDSTIYSLNKTELNKLMSTNNKKITLLLSYGFWCKPCNNYFPKILNLVNNNKDKIDLFLINVEPDNSRRLFLNNYFLQTRFGFFKANFMISEEYSKKKWKKYDAFLIDLIGVDGFDKSMSGMSQNILYKNNKIIYLSNYNLNDDDILKDIEKIINQ